MQPTDLNTCANCHHHGIVGRYCVGNGIGQMAQFGFCSWDCCIAIQNQVNGMSPPARFSFLNTFIAAQTATGINTLAH